MSEFKTERYFLNSERVAQNAIRRIQELSECNHTGLIVEIKDDTRNLRQNALLHAVLTDISNQCDVEGEKLSLEVWKRITMAAWLREEGEQALLIPALDGCGFDIVYELTSKLSVKRCASYIEWLFAFGSGRDVKWSKDTHELQYLEHATRRTRKD